MAKILITGSSDGLGQLAAKTLVAQGHKVVLHARDKNRGQEALDKVPGAESVIIGNLSSLNETIQIASEINKIDACDGVIHNAGIYTASATELFAVNTLAPYILTALIHKPKRLIYLSSGMHHQGSAKLDSVKNNIGRINYSDTKLQVLMLCKAVARKWPDVYANAVCPGWVPTKMGGPGAPDSLEAGYQTQVWLATSNDDKAKVSGRYFFHQKEDSYNSEADDVVLQDKLLNLCEQITQIKFC